MTGRRLDKVRLTHMVIYAHHGAHEEERTLGQRFEIDVDMSVDFFNAATHDRLELCVDYGDVYRIVHDSVTEKKFYLIEAVAQHIARRILDNFDVEEVLVKVRKPNVPIKGTLEHVEVECCRTRKDFDGHRLP
ncbi:MAG: dihydroneopterin aldolase [Bacteroidetes bacterium]|nr:dihydroneopterin aldolase [Bacteroidota bacterium]